MREDGGFNHNATLASVAQQVEQKTENLRVGSSILSGGTIWTLSSVGESSRLITDRSQVRVLHGPPKNIFDISNKKERRIVMMYLFYMARGPG